jgi:predicted Zn-dependent peptidase
VAAGVAIAATGAGATATGATGAPESAAPVNPPEARLTTLDSGVRVVTELMPSVRSVALGFWIRVGSRDESRELAGISHFLEHLLFKGTDRFSSREIDETFDGMGAEVNAGTGKETTSVYSRFLDHHLERAFDVMQDMVLRPAYPDIDSERQVVIEEIAMYEDEPQDKVHDILATAVFGEHPLGRPVIGRAEVISSVPVPEIAAYHDARYTAPQIVVAAAGGAQHERIVELVASSFDGRAHENGELGPASPPPGEGQASDAYAPDRRFHRKDTEQYHLCLGGPGIPRADERRFALRVLDTILGGSSSSRLFQEVREKRGLAYAVYSYVSHYLDSGQVGVYVGTRNENVRETMDVIGTELRRLVEDGVGEEELERARENAKGRTVLAMESTLARMNRLGSSVLMGVPLLTVDEVLEAFDRVSEEDVVALAGELFSPGQMSAAGIGGDEDVFRSALEAVNPALIA